MFCYRGTVGRPCHNSCYWLCQCPSSSGRRALAKPVAHTQTVNLVMGYADQCKILYRVRPPRSDGEVMSILHPRPASRLSRRAEGKVRMFVNLKGVTASRQSGGGLTEEPRQRHRKRSKPKTVISSQEMGEFRRNCPSLPFVFILESQIGFATHRGLLIH